MNITSEKPRNPTAERSQMQIDHREGDGAFEFVLPSGNERSQYSVQEVVGDQPEKMAEDHEWYADTGSLAVELSSVESATMTGIMSMLHEPSSKEYIEAGCGSTDSKNRFSFSAAANPTNTSSNHGPAMHSRGTTSNGLTEDSDACSITSDCSVSSSVLINGRMRNRAASGATAPPSTPAATDEDKSEPHTVGASLFTAPTTNKLEPLAVMRSWSDSTTASNHSNKNNNPFRHSAPSLSISIPTDRTLGCGVSWNYMQSCEHDPFGVRELDSHHHRHCHDTYMSSPCSSQQSRHQPEQQQLMQQNLPQHQSLNQQALMQRSENDYRVEEQDDGDGNDDVESIASDQSLAVEVESVDEEGTYLSYGGDCEDFEPILGYSSDYGSGQDLNNHQQQHNYSQGQSQRRYPHYQHHAHEAHRSKQCEYTVEDPYSSSSGSSSGHQSPQSYTYGRSISTVSTPQSRGGNMQPPESQMLEECTQPSPLYREAHLTSEGSGHFKRHQQGGDSEASERSSARDHSASPSSIYERELNEHQRLYGEGYCYRAATPNNLNNTSNNSNHSDARGGRSINPSSYFSHNYASAEPVLRSTSNSSSNSQPLQPQSHPHKQTLHRRRQHARQMPPIHNGHSISPHSTYQNTGCDFYHNNNSNINNIKGKRKRGDCSSPGDASPYPVPVGKKSNTEYSLSINHEYDHTPDLQNKQSSWSTLWSDHNSATHSHSNSSNSNSNGYNMHNNGSSDSTVNINMRHMHLDTPEWCPNNNKQQN